MVEIAISLAIIGIALVSIIGVLPIGMNTQRDNREETVINQDATVLMEAIRSGARGLDDLTNSVYAITNFWGRYKSRGILSASGANGYSYIGSGLDGAPMVPEQFPITNGLRIIGLLSTPEYTDTTTGLAIPTLMNGGYSNHIVAYVHSISGPAIEKPLQDNPIIRGDQNNPVGDTFGYRVLCVNAPGAADTNLFNFWQASSYNPSDRVLYNWVYWRAITNTVASDVPGTSLLWVKLPFYPQELGVNLHELRLTFFWPQLPNGNLGPGRQTFRTLVAGQVVHTNDVIDLYFYQPQSFTRAP